MTHNNTGKRRKTMTSGEFIRDLVNRVSRVNGWPKQHISDADITPKGQSRALVSDGAGPHDVGRPGEPRPRRGR